jgi:hypothetical protein
MKAEAPQTAEQMVSYAWYRDHLLYFQKEAFGDYMLEESPGRTAEYILRFAKHGTLGKDCSAIF